MNGLELRAGGDPRGHAEFAALCGEMAKLHHPACPDVDWGRVEQGCRALWQDNGSDLQTAAFLTLALAWREGLGGLTEGVALLGRLLGEGWPRLWPLRLTERLDILGWLFCQLQPLLRGLNVDERSAPMVRQLEADLLRVQASLGQQDQLAVASLQAFATQVEKLAARLQASAPVEQGTGVASPLVVTPRPPRRVKGPLPGGKVAARATGVVEVIPIVVQTPVPVVPPPVSPEPERRLLPWCLVGMLALALLGLLVWVHGQWRGERAVMPASGQQSPATAMPVAARGAVPTQVRLDSRLLFPAGSAQLRPESTKVLINALANVKAQPGWRIVIAGHSDVSGDEGRNLRLSQQRAEAVRDWMKSMGDVPDDCFAVQGFGASQPVADNTSEAGRAANRRVDISLVPEPGACLPGRPPSPQ